MWAHAVLDDRPLSHMRGEQGRHTPGQWMLFEEVGELGDEQRGLLDETIRAQDLMLGCWPHTAHKKRRPEHPELSALVGNNTSFVELLWNLVSALRCPEDAAFVVYRAPPAGGNDMPG